MTCIILDVDGSYTRTDRQHREAAMAKCPDCNQHTGAEKGKPTTHHQKPGSREKCSGVGKPAR